MTPEFYKMDFRAWNVGTVDLNLEQEAAYLRICHAMYDARGPIPNSGRLLRGIFRCGNTKAAALVQQLLVAGKIELTDTGAITNRRVTEELAKRDRRSTEQSANGKRGGTASGAARKKANEIKGDDEAHASTQRSREEERREEKSRGEEIREPSSKEVIDLPPLPWEVAPAEQAAPAAPATTPPDKTYAFEAGIIRLTDADFERWQKAYPTINLAGELTSMADWATRLKGEGKNWFTVIPNQLIKLERAAKREREESRMAVEARAKQGARSAPGRPAI